MLDREAEARRMQGELKGRARHRDDLGHECSAAGQFDEARRHFERADDYRRQAEAVQP